MMPARIHHACLLLSLVVAAHAELGSSEAKEPSCDVKSQQCAEDDVALIQTYTHLATQKTKGTTAIESESAWTVIPSNFANTMTVSALVVDGGLGTLAAFSEGGEVRGVQSNPSIPPFDPNKGKPIYQITLYADSGGETISFKFKPNDGEVMPLTETLNFIVNGNIGNVIRPMVLTPMPMAPVAAAWSVTPSDWENSMTMSAVVIINGAVQSSGTLGAFAGATVRGLQSNPSIPPFGPMKGIAVYEIMMYGDGNGDTITFKFKSAEGDITPLKQTKTFTGNAHFGNVLSPTLLTN